MNNQLIYKESDLDKIRDEIFFSDYFSEVLEQYKAKTFVMGTGMGKTHNWWTMGVKILLDRGVTDFLYDAPVTELLDRKVPIEAMQSHGYSRSQFKVWTSDDNVMKSFEEFKMNRELYPINIYLVTDGFWSSKEERKEEYTNFFMGLGKKFSKFRDEIHNGGCSDKESAGVKNGVFRKEYVGGVAKFQDKFLNNKTTPYIFCATATPFDELTDPELGTDNWIMANETIDPARVVSSQSHMKSPLWHNYTQRDDDGIRSLLKNALSDICDDSRIMGKISPWYNEPNNLYTHNILQKHFSPKRTVMIKCQTFNKKGTNVHAGYIMDILASGIVPEGVQYLLDYSGSPHSTISDQKKGWSLRDHNGEVISDGSRGGSVKNPWIGWLNDPNHPLRILVVIDKGQMGINVHNLSTLVSFRSSKNSNDQGLITDSQIQLIGRFQRKYFGGLELNQMKELDNELQHIIFEEMNQFQLMIPDEPSWRKTIKRWTSEEGTTVENLWRHRVA